MDSNTNAHILYGNRSAAYCRLGKYKRALQDAIKARQLNPSWSKAYYRQGMALQVRLRTLYFDTCALTLSPAVMMLLMMMIKLMALLLLLLLVANQRGGCGRVCLSVCVFVCVTECNSV